tara:strand:+ start:7371 stop:7673 length:303 start_codon:yes stop_codon:yes gene_type:complete
MSKFDFTKKKHTGKTNVWYDGILIGELSFMIREAPDIDWPKYRADKTLKLSHSERWSVSWKAHTGGNMANVGTFENKELAAIAILDKHRNNYKREANNNN